MPWCNTCERFYNPNTLAADGTCPTCGRQVGDVVTPAEAESSGSAPWHFKVLIAVTAVYLGYRLFQGVFWVAQHL